VVDWDAAEGAGSMGARSDAEPGAEVEGCAAVRSGGTATAGAGGITCGNDGMDEGVGLLGSAEDTSTFGAGIGDETMDGDATSIVVTGIATEESTVGMIVSVCDGTTGLRGATVAATGAGFQEASGADAVSRGATGSEPTDGEAVGGVGMAGWLITGSWMTSSGAEALGSGATAEGVGGVDGTLEASSAPTAGGWGPIAARMLASDDSALAREDGGTVC